MKRSFIWNYHGQPKNGCDDKSRDCLEEEYQNMETIKGIHMVKEKILMEKPPSGEDPPLVTVCEIVYTVYIYYTK